MRFLPRGVSGPFHLPTFLLILTCQGLIGPGVSPGSAADDPAPQSPWKYGGLVDLSYALNFNFPENHRWRSKGTTPRTNEFAPNLVFGYLRKEPIPGSRWGLEVGGQGGYDTDALVPNPIPGREKPIAGADTLRHISRANASYLVPVGNGLTLTGGLFNSYIGYESFFAKNNLNYTRTYMADNSPYFLFGLGAHYPVNEKIRLGLYVVNGFSYLSHINDEPSYGIQAVWRPASRLTVTENFYYGPDQSSTAMEFWRLFSNSVIEWKGDRIRVALAYDFGTENAAERPGHPRTFWTAGALHTRWHLSGPWSVAVRPEFYWDRNGRITGSEQLLKAVTSTVEYRLSSAWRSAVVRLEHRYDESTGVDGGFFRKGELSPGVIGLVREQHLVSLSVITAFDF